MTEACSRPESNLISTLQNRLDYSSLSLVACRQTGRLASLRIKRSDTSTARAVSSLGRCIELPRAGTAADVDGSDSSVVDGGGAQGRGDMPAGRGAEITERVQCE